MDRGRGKALFMGATGQTCNGTTQPPPVPHHTQGDDLVSFLPTKHINHDSLSRSTVHTNQMISGRLDLYRPSPFRFRGTQGLPYLLQGHERTDLPPCSPCFCLTVALGWLRQNASILHRPTPRRAAMVFLGCTVETELTGVVDNGGLLLATCIAS